VLTFVYLILTSLISSSFYISLVWLLFVVISACLFFRPIRKKCITTHLLRYVHAILPPISETERVALEAGDVWLEADLFRGETNWKEIQALRKPSLSPEETTFLETECEGLCALIDEWSQVYKEGDLNAAVWQYIKEKGFLGLIIPKEFGGKGFSAFAHSTIVMKIASRSVCTATSVMVPNSLGPAELLLHYGTEEQKQTYLPALASGEHIPCFALTSPEAGSDAGSLTDSGVVFEKNGALYIRLSFEKRYITLAPVATLLGVAFKLSDPDNLLKKDKVELGITLALIPTKDKGVSVGERHSPLGLAFMNGTAYGEEVEIPLDYLVGGESGVGQGWRMLMECLSIGRSISLPALSTAVAKLSTRMTGAYAALRKQFRTPIGQFEGIEEPLSRIGGLCYTMEAVRRLTSDAVSQGIKPSLVSAITKYHLTEMARIVMDDAMDIHAGRGIQFGPRNYLGIPYTAIPMLITVEGANILTRNLMIFGQGGTRCHPFIIEEMTLAGGEEYLKNIDAFDKVFAKHLSYSIRNFVRTIGSSVTGGRWLFSPGNNVTGYYYRQLTRMSYAFSFVSDIVMASLGGGLKRRERLSARLGDVLSQLYIATAVLKYYEESETKKEEEIYLRWSLDRSLLHIQEAFNGLFSNLPSRFLRTVLKRAVFPFGTPYKPSSDKLSHQISKSMLAPSALRDKLTAHCYVGKESDDQTGRMENALRLKIESLPLAKKVSSAIKKGMISKDCPVLYQIEKALEKEVLTEEEAAVFKAYELARLDAMKVDTFSFDELLWGNR
jgi:alkylation response protein AidB-like acyl-CoA dehydrogenase